MSEKAVHDFKRWRAHSATAQRTPQTLRLVAADHHRRLPTPRAVALCAPLLEPVAGEKVQEHASQRWAHQALVAVRQWCSGRCLQVYKLLSAAAAFFLPSSAQAQPCTDSSHTLAAVGPAGGRRGRTRPVTREQKTTGLGYRALRRTGPVASHPLIRQAPLDAFHIIDSLLRAAETESMGPTSTDASAGPGG